MTTLASAGLDLPAPRRVRRRASFFRTEVRQDLGTILLAFVVVLAFRGWPVGVRVLATVAGAEAIARITELRTLALPRGGERYEVELSFADAAGIVHKGGASITRRGLERLRLGDPVLVRYVPGLPSLVTLVDDGGEAMATGALLVAVLGGLALLMTGFTAWRYLVTEPRQRYVLANGVPVRLELERRAVFRCRASYALGDRRYRVGLSPARWERVTVFREGRFAVVDPRHPRRHVIVGLTPYSVEGAERR